MIFLLFNPLPLSTSSSFLLLFSLLFHFSSSFFNFFFSSSFSFLPDSNSLVLSLPVIYSMTDDLYMVSSLFPFLSVTSSSFFTFSSSFYPFIAYHLFHFLPFHFNDETMIMSTFLFTLFVTYYFISYFHLWWSRNECASPSSFLSHYNTPTSMFTCNFRCRAFHAWKNWT